MKFEVDIPIDAKYTTSDILYDRRTNQVLLVEGISVLSDEAIFFIGRGSDETSVTPDFVSYTFSNPGEEDTFCEAVEDIDNNDNIIKLGSAS